MHTGKPMLDAGVICSPYLTGGLYSAAAVCRRMVEYLASSCRRVLGAFASSLTLLLHIIEHGSSLAYTYRVCRGARGG